VTGPGAEINSVDPATIEIGEPVHVVVTATPGLPRPDRTLLDLPQWVRA
jgi:hypothetical protein